MNTDKKIYAIVRFFLKKQDFCFAEFPIFKDDPLLIPHIGDTLTFDGELFTKEYADNPQLYDFDYYKVKTIEYGYQGEEEQEEINRGAYTKQYGILRETLIDITVKGCYYGGYDD